MQILVLSFTAFDLEQLLNFYNVWFLYLKMEEILRTSWGLGESNEVMPRKRLSTDLA